VDADHPTGGVLAVEDARGPAVDLDLRDIEGIDELAEIGADHHVIDDQAHSRILAFFYVRIAQTANVDGRGSGAGAGAADIDVGRYAAEILEGSRLDGIELFLVDGADRRRDVLQAFGNPPGGDDDLAHRRGPGGGARGRGVGRQGRKSRHR